MTHHTNYLLSLASFPTAGLKFMEAIVKTGFKGFVAQEFVPKRPDALASLRQPISICDL